jgi:hypothetical protein
MNSAHRFAIALGLVAILAAQGCFLPPQTSAPADERVRTEIPLPYDLAWDCVSRVIENHGLRIGAQDQNHGIIEAEGGRFTTYEADCGKIQSIAGTYSADPSANSTSVYSFLVRPHGPEASTVAVAASFTSGVKVPMQPAYNVDCVSRGTDESTLLKEILVQARRTHRPSEGASPSPSPTTEPTPAPTPVPEASRPYSTISKPIP